MPEKQAPAIRTLVTSLAIFCTALIALTISPSPARADWAHDRCSYAEPRDSTWGHGITGFEALAEPVRFGSPDRDLNGLYELNFSVAKESTIVAAGSFGLSKVLELSLQAGYQYSEIMTLNVKVNQTVPTKAGEFLWARPISIYTNVHASRNWVTPGGTHCASSTTVAKITKGWGVCIYPLNTPFSQGCASPNDWYGGSGGAGGSAPGPVNPPAPPAPQPVTSVHGLADGTVLATTDTQRIYKMVGGAPVWQATCADNICQPQSRPTTQAVINAGPAVPRNGSTAVDQRGRVYVFIGGAPVWQDSCAAPVNCGTPVKMSNWSIDARDHMHQRPADGNLVQAKAGATDLPVAMTLGGALIPFANPQELVDVGQGANWQQRVTAISANSYNLLGFDPADGTLIQGTGGGASTAVAMIVGNAIVPFDNPQEVIDVGYGTDWRSKVRAVPTRVFNARPRTPKDMTLIQGAGGPATPVAQVVGGARINFASPQEVIDAGHGTDWGSKVRAIPARAFNEMRADVPHDGTLVQGPGTAVAAIIGGGRIDFGNPAEVIESGYGEQWGSLVRAIPTRAFKALQTKIADGTRLRKAGSSSQGGIIGGAKIPFHSMDELEAVGYGPRPTQVVPARVWDALPTQIADGTRIKDADSPSQAAIVGGAKIPFHSMDELTHAGYADTPMQVVPGRIWDALPTQIADGTRIKDADSPSQAAIVGGAKIPFHSMDELVQAGYGDKPMRVVPRRIWDALPTQIADGTRIAKAGATSEAAIVGRARIDFHTMAELQASGYGGKLRQVIPVRVWDGLTTQITDGTYVKSPDSAAVWLVNGGRRTSASRSTGVQVIPTRVLDAIPVA